MKKMLKQNKGFSLIELLVAILIMAVIAGTAIMLFGGVLNSSKERADKETAENIKRAILTYMNLTNDTNLSCLGSDESGDLVKKLSSIITISKTNGVSFDAPDSEPAIEGLGTDVIDETDIEGTYGPFLDGSVSMKPQAPGKKGWKVVIDEEKQVVTVTADESDTTVTINESEGVNESEGG